MNENAIVVPALYENLGMIADFLQERAHLVHLQSRKMWELLLAIDEICSHIIDYMDFEQEEGRLKIKWDHHPEYVMIMIETNGMAFNPLDPDMYNDEIEIEEELGGMGFHLINQMVDEITYKRAGQTNTVTIKKFLKSRKRIRKNKVQTGGKKTKNKFVPSSSKRHLQDKESRR